MYLLDTDTVSYLVKRHNENVWRKFDRMQQSELAVSAITVAELYYGLAKFSGGPAMRANVMAFLRGVQQLSFGLDAASEYGIIRQNLTAQGTPIGEMDMLIAAHAIAIDATLVTNNYRHFARVGPPLRLENWTA